MRVVIIGTGYVGLVTGTCFAELGNRVTCVDTDERKIQMLLEGKTPIYEPGLEEMIKRNSESGDLVFTMSLQEALPKAQIVFIAVGTPMGEDGSADLQYVLQVADQIGSLMSNDLVIVNKSTVPVGTADRVAQVVQQAIDARIQAGEVSAAALKFHVLSNPEFLKEGSAITDFMKPDRVVIGADDEKAGELLRMLYEPFTLKSNRIIMMDVKSAELTKYAANAMLATRISFMNEIANLCEKTGANAGKVRIGIGSDSRIGNAFLFPGCGYGGSCFPKDVQALIKMMDACGINAHILKSVEEVNARQKKIMAQKVISRFGEDLTGKIFAIWGLAFKPNTDDVREAPAIDTIVELISRGALIQTYDPEAMAQAKNVYLKDVDGIKFCTNKYDALSDADALLLMTEWSSFRSPDFDEIKERLRFPVIFDGRNQFERYMLHEAGFEYYAIGIPRTQLKNT